MLHHKTYQYKKSSTFYVNSNVSKMTLLVLASLLMMVTRSDVKVREQTLVVPSVTKENQLCRLSTSPTLVVWGRGRLPNWAAAWTTTGRRRRRRGRARGLLVIMRSRGSPSLILQQNCCSWHRKFKTRQRALRQFWPVKEAPQSWCRAVATTGAATGLNCASARATAELYRLSSWSW